MRSKITLLLLAASVLLPVIASTAAPSYAETRVWGFELQTPAGAWVERGSSETGIEGYRLAYDEQVVGYPLVPRGGASARRFVDGDLFEAAVPSKSGNVTVLAETSVSGNTLTLSDLVIYADDGTLVNQVGARQFLALRNQVGKQAAEAGFDTLRITGVRVPTSSSANPGKTIERVFDLSRFRDGTR